LQQDDGAKTIARIGQSGVAFGGQGSGVFGADADQRFAYRPFAELIDRTGAEELEGMGSLQFVPELFQRDRRGMPS
jgi:hypothetical protein